MSSDITPDNDPSADFTDEIDAAMEAEASEHDELRAERDQYLELAKRTRADFENYQKRVARDQESLAKYAIQPVVQDMLPLLDGLDRALSAVAGGADPQTIIAGVELVRKQLADIFKKHGIVAIDPTKGEAFDPNCHEAMMQQPSTEVPPMGIVQTLQIGYKLHDRVVRPAQVIVAAGG